MEVNELKQKIQKIIDYNFSVYYGQSEWFGAEAAENIYKELFECIIDKVDIFTIYDDVEKAKMLRQIEFDIESNELACRLNKETCERIKAGKLKDKGV